MADREASVKFKADSTEFNSAIKSASAQVREMQSALKLNAEQMKVMGTSADSLTQREKLLAQEAEALAAKKAALADKLKLAEECFGADSTQASSLRTQLSGLETQSVRVEAEIADVNAQLQAQREAEAKAETATEQLTGTISSQQSELDGLKKQYVEAVLQYGDTSDEAKGLAAQITDLSGDLKENKATMAAAEDAADALDQTMDDAGDAVEDAGDAAEESSEGWTTFKGVIADLASEAIQTAINALRELASEVMETGIETETAFAKLETISGADAIDDLTDSMRELSTETGVSAAELADVAYNAISAGSSAEEAADVVEAATKLGVAGFADTSDALSILSTAMNSYGDEAGTVEEISDSLIQVQNLGVTTIGELASGMGKAIAMGSAYNVNLSNLESAYVSLTKNGISTAESTTYLNSMIKELGDAGSGVSLILKEKTGKSFSELMSSGYSLSDVLGVLYDSVDGDATALNNLWSSAEAGLASSAIVTQGLETFNENLEAITSSAGATEIAYSTMADTTETKLAIMEQSFANLGLSIYDGLDEPLNNVIDFVTDTVIPSVADLIEGVKSFASEVGSAIPWDALQDGLSATVTWFENLTDAVGPSFLDAFQAVDDLFTIVGDTVEPLVTSISDYVTEGGLASDATELLTGALETVADTIETAATWLSDFVTWVTSGSDSADVFVAVIAGVAAAFAGWTIVQTVTGFISTLIGIVQGAKTAFALFNAVLAANPLGVIVALIAGVVAVLVTLWNTNEGFREAIINAWESIKSTVSDAVDAVAGFFSNLGASASSLVSSISDAWDGIMSAASDAVSSVASAVSEKWESIKSATSTAWDSVKSSVSTAVSNVATSVSTKWNAIKSTTSTVFNGVKSVASTAWSGIKSSVSTAVTNVATSVSTKWNAIKSTTSTAFNAVKTAITGPLNIAKTIVTNILTDIKNTFSSIMNSAKTIVSNAISKIKSFFNFTWSLPKLKMPHITIKGKFSLSPLSVPSFSISWYKEGGVLNAATIFGASGSSLLGGGEAGPEAVAPIDVLQSYVAAAVDRSISDSLSQVAQAIEALAQRPIYLNVNGKTFAAATAGDFDTALGSRQALSARGLCL